MSDHDAIELGPITWEEANENEHGILTIAYQTESYAGLERETTVGYNGILKGDRVVYAGEQWTVVQVSRLGLFGLSKTGALPYTERVWPDEVELLPQDGAAQQSGGERDGCTADIG